MDNRTKEKFFRELMEEYYEKVYIFISRGNADKAFAEDVVQETFLEAYRKAELLMEHPNIIGWLYTTAKHKVLKLLSRKENAYSLDDENYEIYKTIPFREWNFDEIELVETIKSSISEKDYAMLRDYYLNGYSSEEVAAKYGLDKGGFRMRISRLKKKLRTDIIEGGMSLGLLFALWILW